MSGRTLFNFANEMINWGLSASDVRAARSSQVSIAVCLTTCLATYAIDELLKCQRWKYRNAKVPGYPIFHNFRSLLD